MLVFACIHARAGCLSDRLQLAVIFKKRLTLKQWSRPPARPAGRRQPPHAHSARFSLYRTCAACALTGCLLCCSSRAARWHTWIIYHCPTAVRVATPRALISRSPHAGRAHGVQPRGPAGILLQSGGRVLPVADAARPQRCVHAGCSARVSRVPVRRAQARSTRTGRRRTSFCTCGCASSAWRSWR
jgi:hypothetical protein